MRSFIAFEVKTQSKLSNFIANLKATLSNDKVKWVRLPVLHQTLFFLGEVTEEQFESVKNSLSQYLHDIPSFEIRIKGLGIFGNSRNPKVIWVGIEESEPLNKLHRRVCNAVMPLGFVPDKRGFNPHITIGRVKFVANLESLRSIIYENKSRFFQKSLVNNVTIYKSDLTPQGPLYTPLFSQKLKPPI
ncbi:MAG: RNA 2',3'-cyclic phosphodiesterase [Bacteroidales bacterium]